MVHKRNNHFNISEIPMGLPQTQLIITSIFNVVSQLYIEF